MADHQKEGIMAEELRLIALEEASDLLFSNQGLLSHWKRDLRAKRRMEDTNEMDVRRKIEHDDGRNSWRRHCPVLLRFKKKQGKWIRAPGTGKMKGWRIGKGRCSS